MPNLGDFDAGITLADGRVERSLYRRAVGYSYDAVKIFMPAGTKKPIYAPVGRQRAGARPRLFRGGAGTPISGQAAHARRGPAPPSEG